MVRPKNTQPRTISGARRHLLLGAVGTALSVHPALARIKVRDEAIRVVRRGAGRDVIFLPGLGASGDVWAASAAAVQAGVRSHIVYFAGFAGEPATSVPRDGFLRSRASAVAQYIAQQRLVRPLLVAHSGAVAMAIMLALEQPSLLEGMMLVDGLPFPAALELGPTGNRQQAAEKAERDFQTQRSMRGAEYVAYRRQEASNSAISTDHVHRVAQWAIRSDRASLMQADRELGGLDLRDSLEGLQMPLTIVYADQASLGAPPGWMKQVYQGQYVSLKRSPILVEIADAQHFLMLDQPRRFLAALLRFVGVVGERH
jgi:pimeloyl-[acyl-carrier protein] methyl ester esterase